MLLPLPNETHDDTTNYCNNKTLNYLYLKALFGELKGSYRPVYLYLASLSPDEFSVNRRFEGRMSRQDGCAGDVLTLEEFMSGAGIGGRDEFYIWYGKRIYTTCGEFDRGRVFDWYRSHLRRHCAAGLLGNCRLELTRARIREYGLGRDDAAWVRRLLERYNADLTAGLQAQYDMLKRLECIVK